MLLTQAQRDSLGELINIGFGRAANALSILVGQRVLLEAPMVDIYPLDELGQALNIIISREITTIHQVFSGKLCGDIMLLMDIESASVLVDLLSGGEGESHPLTPEDQEALVETGNILLNAFIGSFGNLLNVHISFAVPNLKLESIPQLLASLTIDNHEVEYTLLIRIHYRLRGGDVSGYVMIVMGVQSLEALFDAMRSEGYLP